MHGGITESNLEKGSFEKFKAKNNLSSIASNELYNKISKYSIPDKCKNEGVNSPYLCNDIYNEKIHESQKNEIKNPKTNTKPGLN